MNWAYCFKVRSKNSSGTVQKVCYPKALPTAVGPPTYEPVMLERTLIDRSLDDVVLGFRPHLSVGFIAIASGRVDGYGYPLETVLADLAQSGYTLEACLHENLLTAPSALNNAAWTKTDLTTGSASMADPTGATSTVYKGIPGAADSYAVQDIASCPTLAAGAQFTFSVYLQAASGTPSINISLRNQSNTKRGETVCALTTSWQRFSVTGTMQAGDTTLRVMLGGDGSWPVADGDVWVWGAQLADGQLHDYAAAGDWKRVLLKDSYSPAMPDGKRNAISAGLNLVASAIQATIPTPDSGGW